MQFHLIFVCIHEVVYKVFCSVKSLDLWHSELYWKREVQHPGCELGFGLLYQGVHGDWSSALYCFLHVADFLLNVPEPLLPRPLLCLLLIKDGPIAFVVPALPLLIAVLSGGLVRIMLPGVASFSFSIHFSTRVEVLLFSGNRILAFSGLSCLLGALYFPGELLQFFQQVLVGDAKCLHLVLLTCTVSNLPPRGRLSTSPGWSCILGGLGWLLHVFRVDTISH